MCPTQNNNVYRAPKQGTKLQIKTKQRFDQFQEAARCGIRFSNKIHTVKTIQSIRKTLARCGITGLRLISHRGSRRPRPR